MADPITRLCAACGAPLRESDTFCTRCGATKAVAAPVVDLGPPIKTLPLMIFPAAVWALIGLAFGIYFISSADFISSQLGQPYFDMFAHYGIGAEAVPRFFLVFGTILTVSALLAAVTMVLCITKRYYKAAVAACLISALLTVVIVIGLIGLVVAYYIYSAKDEFKDRKTRL